METSPLTLAKRQEVATSERGKAHILIQGPPQTAKTHLAKLMIAQAFFEGKNTVVATKDKRYDSSLEAARGQELHGENLSDMDFDSRLVVVCFPTPSTPEFTQLVGMISQQITQYDEPAQFILDETHRFGADPCADEALLELAEDRFRRESRIIYITEDPAHLTEDQQHGQMMFDLLDLKVSFEKLGQGVVTRGTRSWSFVLNSPLALNKRLREDHPLTQLRHEGHELGNPEIFPLSQFMYTRPLR